jgi:HAD superfamily hydrolase (TIGR01509 family)
MKAFIFDFDGVIVDSERRWKETGKTFFPALIPTWTDADGARLTGLGFAAAYKMLVEEYSLNMSFEDYAEKRHAAAVDDTEEHKILPIHGLIALLERLQLMSMPIAIGSSAGRDWINRTLARLKLHQHFPVIVSADDVNHRTKPAPDIYLLVAEKLGVQPTECVVLEDSYYGVTAAKAAGMTCIAYRSDINGDQDLSKADAIVTHYEELTDEVLRTL